MLLSFSCGGCGSIDAVESYPAPPSPPPPPPHLHHHHRQAAASEQPVAGGGGRGSIDWASTGPLRGACAHAGAGGHGATGAGGQMGPGAGAMGRNAAL